MTNKFHGLVNVWNGVAALFGLFAAIFFSISHPFLALLCSGIAASFGLIALHFELDERFGSRFRYTALVIGIGCWIALFFIYLFLEPTNDQRGERVSKGSMSDSAASNQIMSGQPIMTRPKKKAYDKVERNNLRAVVDIDDMELTTFEVGKRIEVKFSVNNRGETPAHDVTLFGGVKSGTGVYNQEVAWFDTMSNFGHHFIDKHYGYDAYCAGDTLTQAMISALLGGKYRIYVAGRIRYLDVYGIHDSTNFCAYYDFMKKTFLTYDKYSGVY